MWIATRTIPRTGETTCSTSFSACSLRKAKKARRINQPNSHEEELSDSAIGSVRSKRIACPRTRAEPHTYHRGRSTSGEGQSDALRSDDRGAEPQLRRRPLRRVGAQSRFPG